jgi:Uma2 family endonuclease
MASLPRSERVTYEAWLQMPEVSESIEEVVNGEIRITPAPKWNHSEIVDRLAWQIKRQVDDPEVIVKARTVEVLVLESGQFRRSALLAEGILKPACFPNVQIDITQIWPD